MKNHFVKCQVCGQEVKDLITDHLQEAHGLTVADYLSQHPTAEVASARLIKLREANPTPDPQHPPGPENLIISMAEIPFRLYPDVPTSACLPMPDHYRVPLFGALGEDVEHALTALAFRRSLYLWGLPGSGKDALIHAWSSLTRTPAILRQIRPGADIEGWFFSRAFNEKGTYWEEGDVLVALRDGYLSESGRNIPYLVLLTDFDRAEKEQAESIRLIADSIQGRVDGPGGRTYPVLPGSIVTATANTAGGGDERGRMVSANLLDGSLMDRWQRKFQFHWMDWLDEEPIVQAKFPLLFQVYQQGYLDKFKLVTKNIREAILDDRLMGEFSHRGLCSILGHATDILTLAIRKKDTPPQDLFKKAVRAWVDGIPDRDNRTNARAMIDPVIAILPTGDVSHIDQNNPLVPGF